MTHAGPATIPTTPDEAWAALVEPVLVEPVPAPTGTQEPGTHEPSAFDPATLTDLPGPARRWLSRVLPPGTPLGGAVEVEMRGRLRLGPRWFPFRADQILRPGVGFVWRPVVGGHVLRFTGADLLVGSTARMEFRFHGRVPVVDATGDDVARSAAGRLAGETAVWAPQAMTPQAGARWQALDDDRAIAVLPVPMSGAVTAEEDRTVEVGVDASGRLTSVRLDRWNASATPPAADSFGGPITRELVTSLGTRIAGSGSAGWGWHGGPEAGEEFFRYRIVAYTRIP